MCINCLQEIQFPDTPIPDTKEGLAVEQIVEKGGGFSLTGDFKKKLNKHLLKFPAACRGLDEMTL